MHSELNMKQFNTNV